ncbi:MAG: caspase family protein [Flavobacterium sp.]|nr:caspase family protein [Pyrinomonadaceae bacterium]MCU0350411.1 caspase family protein [Flavobacterium sp.]
MRGVVISIGISNVDNTAYGVSLNGYDKLFSCETDASNIFYLFKDLGFGKDNINTDLVLLDQNPTAKAVIDAIHNFAPIDVNKPKLNNNVKSLENGDILIIYFSGHGMTKPDENKDEEYDVAWCLRDRPLLDDELTASLACFDNGVRILVISDSCHSGTVVDLNSIGVNKNLETQFNSKVIQSAVLKENGYNFLPFEDHELQKAVTFLNKPQIKIERQKNIIEYQQKIFETNFNNSLIEFFKENSLTKPNLNKILDRFKNLDFNRKLNFSKNSRSFAKLINSNNNLLNKLPTFNFQETFVTIDSSTLKQIPLIKGVKTLSRDIALNYYKKNRDMIIEKRNEANEFLQQKLTDSGKQTKFELLKDYVILLAACQDNETTLDGGSSTTNSDYTCAINKSWAEGVFTGNYLEFNEKIKERFKDGKSIKCNDETRSHIQHPQIIPKVGSFLTEKPIFKI